MTSVACLKGSSITLVFLRTVPSCNDYGPPLPILYSELKSSSFKPQYKVIVSVGATVVEQNFHLRSHQKLSQSTKLPQNFWGHIRTPRRGVKNNYHSKVIYCAPPPFSIPGSAHAWTEEHYTSWLYLAKCVLSTNRKLPVQCLWVSVCL